MACVMCQLSRVNEILKRFEEGKNIDTVYLDFSKTFDKVDIIIMCHKLRDSGIHGNLALWIYNFLTNRQQAIIVIRLKSTSSAVTSGVPQGTVFVPLLSLIMINCIDENISESIISIFADYIRVTKVINKEEDIKLFQEDLDKFYIRA